MSEVHFDLYTWRARVLPTFIVLFPIGIACGLWLPNFMVLGRLIGSLVGPLGLAMLLSQIGRDRGYRKQAALWLNWGGSPTVQLLRHRNDDLNPVIRQRYHQKLRLLRPDLSLPALEDELSNPTQADQIYEACIKYLIGRTRDRKKYCLVFKENVNYGFRRNLWGLKPYGIGLSTLALIACVSKLMVEGGARIEGGVVLAATSLSLVFLVFWIVGVTENWVRIPADAYAARLLESCEDLDID